MSQKAFISLKQLSLSNQIYGKRMTRMKTIHTPKAEAFDNKFKPSWYLCLNAQQIGL